MASASKTPNLNLPQWVGTEKPERTDFNAAFDAIDTTVASHLAEIANRGYISNKGFIAIDANTIVANGKYSMEDCLNMPTNPASRTIFVMDVIQFDISHIVHEAVCVYTNSTLSLLGKKFIRRRQAGTWTAWKEIATTDKGEGFLAVLQNGWTGSLTYSKNDLSQLHIRGMISPGTIALNTTVTTLPSGYFNPSLRIPLIVYDSTKGLSTLGLVLWETGTIQAMSPLNTSISAGDSIFVNQVIQI